MYIYIPSKNNYVNVQFYISHNYKSGQKHKEANNSLGSDQISLYTTKF